MFDERFVGWSFNRAQQVEHLRLLGFEFRILAQAYGELVPREGVESVANESLESVEDEALKLVRDEASVGRKQDQEERMKSLFKTWYSEVKDQRRVERVRVCSEEERRKRETVIHSFLP